jgi:hypothetical protein
LGGGSIFVLALCAKGGEKENFTQSFDSIRRDDDDEDGRSDDDDNNNTLVIITHFITQNSKKSTLETTL